MTRRRIDPKIAQQRAEVATAVRLDRPDADERRRTLREAVLAQHIQEAVAAAPPFTPEQIDRLRSLLPPVQENEKAASL